MIYRAKNTDIEPILALTRACALDMISRDIYQWNEDYPSAEKFLTDIERKELYVYKIKGTIQACIVISTHKDSFYETVNWLTPSIKNFYIHRLAVHPRYQRKGIATSLMDYALSCAHKQNIASIRLDTFSQNNGNRRFYENRGYTALEEIYFPEQSIHPFICYEKPLGGR